MPHLDGAAAWKRPNSSVETSLDTAGTSACATPPGAHERTGLLDRRELRVPAVPAPRARIPLCRFTAQPLDLLGGEPGVPEPGGQAVVHAATEGHSAAGFRPGARRRPELRRPHVQPGKECRSR